MQVLLGGGRRHWLPKVAHDPEQTKEEGRRLDGRNLIDDWLRDKKKRGVKAEYVWNKGQLDKINPNQVDHLLGELFRTDLIASRLTTTLPGGGKKRFISPRPAASIVAAGPIAFVPPTVADAFSFYI